MSKKNDRRVQNWTRGELVWYQDDPDFDDTGWWLLETSGRNPVLNFEHTKLKIFERPNKSNAYHSGPIYWETFRRHPQLKELILKVQGDASFFPSPMELLGRLDIFPKPQQAVIFYLLLCYRQNWLELQGDISQRFNQFLPEFFQLTPGNDGISFILGVHKEKQWSANT